MRSKPKPLSDEAVALFRQMVLCINGLDDVHEAVQSGKGWEPHSAMCKQLYNSVSGEEFEQFLRIMQDANDPDVRSPK